jgi:hypothetical protein
MEFSLLFDFAGTKGSVEKLEPSNVANEILEKLLIEPLTKKNITSVPSTDNFAAEDWPFWDNDRSTNPPQSYITSFVRPRKPGEAIIEDEKETLVGLRLRPSSLVFNLARAANGPRYYQWRSSVDGFEKPLPIANFPQSQIDRGCEHNDGIITLPPEPPTSPAFFGPFFIDFRQLAKSDGRWRALEKLDVRLYGYFK